ncbi:glycosyl hydrolase [Tenacibaculum sp. SG-28]|uniref:VPS10 domain-containing protein n=1 Tax=Tenacibaculum sp. SG-28 TaxID=754426 RepID=UPI000CF539AB|nr:glycosyl hydrolase [Tenacibaculum sp. SG-28]PQJ21740.1 glycosyl hydrolase [Tenacibaculum sp. SG-28]
MNTISKLQKSAIALCVSFIFFCCIPSSFGQNTKKTNNVKKVNNSAIFNGLKFRSIGPALMSGRIADIVIHPKNENIWYVAVASGGVWKTENSGTTWNSIFDGQVSYSIGCITLDPQNPDIVWVGTGENVGGRHIGYGDGIYKSENGGKSWKNMGLQKSEHLSKIIIHPTDSNIMWVASQGPLWSSGGERGVYKSTDGGKTWERKIGDAEWVGATDLLIDPRNPDLLYAATWQRHRTVAGYLGGGPGSGIHKSTDGGETWTKLSNGLPGGNMGKIGLAISPQKPDVVYAAIELDRRKGGVYKSENKGGSWKKMSDAVSGGTGPHYYQELYASPHRFDHLFLANNYMLESFDGGKTFSRMNESEKHVDNHAVAFKNEDPNYILVGCDGGLYESFDNTKNWKFIDNLPVTQFYKIAVDDAEPFYYVYGGTQDNNTQAAPSRTDNIHGIRNSDWFIVLGGDGHQPATEPGNPNVVYAQWQQGNLNRHDRASGENVSIKPQPELGEKTERYNWDAPILVSPHNPKRIYHASQRVWKSEDRGDSWQVISKDLTKNIERIQTPFYGKKQKWDNAWDIYAMSNYSTITSLSESPKQEGLLYAGTDDGIIQVTEDGGANWRKINFSKIKGLPETAFVNDIKADLYDANVVYAVFDNHKYGDYQPYLFKSTNKGKTWENMANNLPDRTLLWRIVQDHVNSNLLFLGTEYGVYFSTNKGKTWTKLKGGLPNIAVRDLAIQKRENDLIAGTFGRGIYILDDYSALRNIDSNKEAQLFAPRDGKWYKQRRVLGGGKKASQGDNFYVAENPSYGVEFTYYIKDEYQSKVAKRLAQEKEIEKNNGVVATPEWSVLEAEQKEIKPELWLFIYDTSGNILRRIQAKNAQGIHRTSWDLSTEPTYTISANTINNRGRGYMVAPGTYAASLLKQIDGKYTAITDKVTFSVVPFGKSIENGSAPEVVVAHWKTIGDLSSKVRDLQMDVSTTNNKIKMMLKAYDRAPRSNENLHAELLKLRGEMQTIDQQFNGSKARGEVGEKNEYPSIRDYMWAASANSTYGPTAAHLKYLENAKSLFRETSSKLKQVKNGLTPLEKQLELTGAPKIIQENIATPTLD